MHAHQGKHSTCTNKTDCQKGPAFSVGPHSGQLAISVRIGMTWRIVSEVGKNFAHASLEYLCKKGTTCLLFSDPAPASL